MAGESWDFVFDEFVRELQMAALIARNPEKRRAFAAKYAKEFAFISMYLHDLGVTGGETAELEGPPRECDLCGASIARQGFFVDGETRDGAFANMCPDCFIREGAGVGWGIGQLYRQLPDRRWKCVAGGDPQLDPPE